MAASWTDEETYKLINFKSEHAIQAMLEDCRRNKDIFEDLSRNASGFEKNGQQQCSGKIMELGWIIGRLNTVQEKPVEVGRNGRFLKPWMLL